MRRRRGPSTSVRVTLSGKRRSVPVAVGNLLPATVASLEAASSAALLDGDVAFSPTIAHETSLVADGVGAARVTSTAAFGVVFNTPTGTDGAVVTAGAQYTARVDCANPAANGVNVECFVSWYNAAGVKISDSSGVAEAVGAGYGTLDITATAPALSAFAAVGIYHGGGVGVYHFYDKFGIFAGASSAWVVS